MRERTITVDINKNYHKSLNYKQYDNNNVLNIIIKEDDNLVDITNYTARAFYQLPSKTVIQRNTTKNGKNTIKLKIDKVILAESGRISLEVVINNVDTVVTTFTLFIDVEKSIDRNEAIEGYPEWDIIADGLSHLDDVENRMSIAENEIVDIESEVSTVKNRVSTVEGEVADIKNEVIDARDGETSLKARLDRDTEKAKQVYVNVEGSNISTDSSSGYAKDVEILGNTIQDASNLADIRSVGDKVEGQELYEIPVVSCGKNLCREVEHFGINISNGQNNTGVGNRTNYIRVKQGLEYTFSKNNVTRACVKYYYNRNKEFISADNVITNATFTIPQNVYYLRLSWGVDVEEGNYQLEEGTVATPYEPYQEDKLTILSPVQLEKGDILKEVDGVWGIEKSVITINPNDNLEWIMEQGTASDMCLRFRIKNNPYITGMDTWVISSHFGTVLNNNGYNIEGVGVSSYDNYGLLVWINKDKLNSFDSQGFNQWRIDNNVIVKLAITNPQFIPLPHSQQVKLRTFANKTNISFLTEIEGTIKAQVPKSLGATVNTHTEQINNLNKELDRVKKLEESTVSTVTTESGFTTVEETANGYFEDVKLEGKTLVNLFSVNYFSASSDRIYSNYSSNHAQNLTTGKLITAFNFSSRFVYLDVYNDTTWVKVIRIKPYDRVLVQLNGTEHIPRYLGLFSDGWENTEVFNQELGKTCFILEGDHTQNPPSYFEGLKSVGQDVDEVSVESVNENLFDMSSKYEDVIISEDGSKIDTRDWRLHDFIKVKPNGTYYLCDDGLNFYQFNIALYDSNKNFIGCIGRQGDASRVYIMPSNAFYCRINYSVSVSGIPIIRNNIMLNEGTTPKPYTPYQSDKKPLLYYNEATQTWEKPILRQWDSIEKHADGKYYYHQRSGEVVLNGSENGWVMDREFENTVYFRRIILDSKKEESNEITNIICCKFNAIGSKFGWLNDEECITLDADKKLSIRISKSKLSTQDVQGFKQWLQDNPTTVVYQLAQEEVYECTNIDLITYANETNYVVESGAIVPKSTLKVMSNISNTVRELQRKVSTLESYIQYVMIDALNNALNE